MRRNIVFAQLIIFAVISVSIISYTIFGVIGADPTASPISVTVKLKTGGGVFEGSEVAYRGVGVGTVDSVELKRDAVIAQLTIDEGTKIPADSVAHIYNLSVAGEQYVDLVPPANHSSELLKSGAVIPAERTTTPIAVANVLLDVQRLVTSIDPKDVRTVGRELAAAFATAGPDLRQLLASATSLVQQLSDSKSAMVRLVRNGRISLDTVARHSGDFKIFSESLRALTDTLKAKTPAFERFVAQAPGTTKLIDGVVRDDASAASVLMANLVTFGDIQVANIPGLRSLLIAVPEFGRRLPLVTRDGKIHAAGLLNYSQRVCSYGVPIKSPLDPSQSPVYDSSCTLLDLPRGAANAPRSYPVRSAGTRSATSTRLTPASRPAVTTYDPDDGTFTAPDGSSARLGYTGGQDRLYGDRSWQTLLAPVGVTR